MVTTRYSDQQGSKLRQDPYEVQPIENIGNLYKKFCSSCLLWEGYTKTSYVMRHFTRNGTDQCRNGSSNLLTPYQEQPRSTPSVVAYPRPAFSATKRTNHAPISFDQQAQVSQGHAFCTEIGEIEIPRSMVVEALSW